MSNSKYKGFYTRGYLPHADFPKSIQHITFHLADALPKAALERMKQKIELLNDEEQKKEKRKQLQELLDAGYGSCVLKDETNAKIVCDSLLFGHGERYELIAWVVMPNHVHVLIEQNERWPLGKIVQSWKRHTAREINRKGAPSCTRQNKPLWQREYFDRFIRNEKYFNNVMNYIEENPLKAGLVNKKEDWMWSSAGWSEVPSATRRSQE